LILLLLIIFISWAWAASNGFMLPDVRNLYTTNIQFRTTFVISRGERIRDHPWELYFHALLRSWFHILVLVFRWTVWFLKWCFLNFHYPLFKDWQLHDYIQSIILWQNTTKILVFTIPLFQLSRLLFDLRCHVGLMPVSLCCVSDKELCTATNS
jgi:hypothetical protein